MITSNVATFSERRILRSTPSHAGFITHPRCLPPDRGGNAALDIGANLDSMTLAPNSKEPKITLNCSRITLQGGLRTFSEEVISALVLLGYAVKVVLPTGMEAPRGAEVFRTPTSLAGASNISWLRPLRWLAYSRFRFPIASTQRVFCTTHHVLPGRGAQIVTVHDLRPYFYPDNPMQGFYFQKVLPKALRRCDGIITVSETSRNLIAEVYGISVDRIAVVPNVISAPEEPLENPGFGAQTDPKSPYLLAVGASWPHKNIESLLHQHKHWSRRYRLKIVAGAGQYRDHLATQAHSLGIASQVQFLENVSAEDLRHLYANCTALVAPSIMEGFGIPPLEAMAHARPVIVSDIPVFRELYGEHALYIAPTKSSSWQTAFDALPNITQDVLERARNHACSFSRQRMACALDEALRRFWNLP